MNRNLVIGIVVVLVLIGAGWFLLKDQLMPASTTMENEGSEAMEQSTPSDSMMAESSPADAMESTGSSEMTPEGQEIVVTASNFKFDKPEIRVKAGDTVKIKFVNTQGFHDFVIDEFNVKTKQQNGPSEEMVTFVADKPGTYEYYCSVGQHRAMGMKGSLIVE